ncbi:DUF2806 domain-containing protein [Brevundimonas sp.]|uniref:DUF2806 domain-containing protein n=1 Tax=Brevundimonas sp. TaxID=1871086 RepID=UPI003783F5AA
MNENADTNSGSLISDVAGLGKIATQIVEAFTRATGALYRPRAIRSEAEAKAHEIIVLADAQSKANAITRLGADEIEFQIQKRAAHRVVATAVQEQMNLENIIEASLALTSPSLDEATKPFDNGWFARFMDGARSVSHSELQQVWSAILTRQARDGQFSLRLLDCVKNLESEDVRAFEKFVWIKRAWSTILTWPDFLGVSRYHDCRLLSSEEADRLIDAGLIEHGIYIAAKSVVPPVSVRIKLMGRLYDVTAQGDTIGLHNLSYTRVGKELETVVAIAPATMIAELSEKSEEFLKGVASSVKRDKLTFKLVDNQN